jgi:NarL family two-component system response regulator LiaR
VSAASFRNLRQFVETLRRGGDLVEVDVEVDSNLEIAETLVIGEGTVRTHVSNILAKLHLANRTQAALYALREGLAPLNK